MWLHKLTLLLLCISNCISINYNNYTLYRGTPRSVENIFFFNVIGELFEVDYWKWPGLVNRSVEFVVAPEKKNALLTKANEYGIALTVLIDDIQRAFDNQIVKNYVRRDMQTFDWNNFYRTDDVYNWMKDLAKAYPKEMTIDSIGKTQEQRDILAVRITLKGNKERSRVIIEGGIHAREWISVSFVTYLLHQILTSAESANKELKFIANSYEWYFVPILNPDGYEYTHVKDRLFRKNKNYVDLNRNFAYEFGKIGASRDRKSEIYCGERAFSEAESTSMKDFVKTMKNRLEYYISFHSYGQAMIIPYGDTEKHLENYEEVKMMCQIAGRRIEKRYGSKYSVGNAYSTVGYKVSGSSTCWVKKTFHVPYVITFELRDRGTHGFALPSELIIPTCEETLDGFVSLFPEASKMIKLNKQNNTNKHFNTHMYVYFMFFLRVIY